MVELAKNNSPEDFRKIYNTEFPKKTFKRYQQNTDMFEKMMSEPGYMEDFMTSMFKFIYDKLKNKGEKQMIRHVEQKSVAQVLPDDKIIYKIPKYNIFKKES